VAKTFAFSRIPKRIRTLDPLAVTQGFIVAAKSLIKHGKLVGEVELKIAELGTEITLLVLVID
jgi:hypothetical protein